MRTLARLALPLVLWTTGTATASAALIGPDAAADVVVNTPYLQFSDSPFVSLDFSSGYFYLETFETADGGTPITTPGVSASNGGPVSVVFGPSIHDSVDADDGTIDGSGLQGESWFFSSGSTGVTFTFNALALGGLPTHAGLVWTDGAGTIGFEAFDENGISLGTLSGNHATAGFSGQTDEDRFYGAVHPGGISAIRLSNSSGGIELDHLQYGIGQIDGSAPEPATFLLIALGSLGIALVKRGQR